MTMTIYLEDLSNQCRSRIMRVLEEDLLDEIEEAVERGTDRGTARIEAVDNHLNTHNFGWKMEI